MIREENKRVGRFNNAVSSNIGRLKGLLRGETRLEEKTFAYFIPALGVGYFYLS